MSTSAIHSLWIKQHGNIAGPAHDSSPNPNSANAGELRAPGTLQGNVGALRVAQPERLIDQVQSIPISPGARI